jgi:hypothetical protein
MPPVTTISCGAEFPLTDLGPDHEALALAEYTVCVKQERKQFKRLVKARAQPKAFETWAYGYMKSGACAFVAMIEQAKRLPRWKRLPVSVYHDLSKSLSPFQPITEPVEFWYEPKTSGNGHRLLHDFGPMHRAAQHMVTRVLSARFMPKHFQYGIEKRGQTAAIEFIKANIGSGHHYGVTLDVKDFFNSFSRETLVKLLPLPKSVIANVVIPNTLALKPKKGAKTHKHSIQGCASTSTYPVPSHTVLPQGSVCSNIAAAYVVSLLDIVLPPGVILVNYVDDLCLMAKNADDLKLAKNALLLAFEESTAGDFTFDISEETLDDGGLRFLGYHLQFIPGTKKLLVSPTYEAIKAHKEECKLREGRIITLAKKPFHKAGVAVAIADYYSYRLAWAMAFKVADDFLTMLENAAKALVRLCLKHGAPVTYAKELVGAKFTHEIIKTPKKTGGYSVKIKITDLKAALAAISPNDHGCDVATLTIAATGAAAVA